MQYYILLVVSYFILLTFPILQFLGKGENIWDRLIHTHPELVRDGTNADIACDSYHKYKEDVELIKTIGVCI